MNKKYYCSTKIDCDVCTIPECDKKNCLLNILPQKVSKNIMVVYDNKADMPLICNECTDYADKERKICRLSGKKIASQMKNNSKSSACPIRSHLKFGSYQK